MLCIRSKFGYLLLHLKFVARNLLQGILARGDELLGCPAICDARSSFINAQIWCCQIGQFIVAISIGCRCSEMSQGGEKVKLFSGNDSGLIAAPVP